MQHSYDPHSALNSILITSMHSSQRSYHLPDLHSICPWKAGFNPHHDEVATASFQWLLSYLKRTPELCDKVQVDVLKHSCGELLASYAYPRADAEKLRICADFMNFLFFIDEITDRESGQEAESKASIFLNAMRDNSFDDGTIYCQISKDFGRRFFLSAGAAISRRFLAHFEAYLNAVGKEAKLREQLVLLDIDTFEALRRPSSAVPVAFDLIGYSLGIDLPDQVFHHPAFTEIQLAAVDMITWSNDLYSYNMEQSTGLLTCNILAVLQREQNATLQESSDLVGAHFKALVDRFEAAKSRLPSFDEQLDEVVLQYVIGLGDWIAGNLDWSFATQRYFGKSHEVVKETLIVDLYSQRMA